MRQLINLILGVFITFIASIIAGPFGFVIGVFLWGFSASRLSKDKKHKELIKAIEAGGR